MPTLFLVDQSLDGIGGHCYDYAKCMVDAAARRDLRVVVGTHRRFRPDAGFAPSGRVIPAFRRTSYSKYSFLAGLNGVTRQTADAVWFSPPQPSGKSWLHRLASQRTYRRFHQQRSTHIQQFAADCEWLFRREVFEEHDHAIFAGVSELDLMGLAAYLANHPRTLQVHWHLLFHFNVFAGRPAEYGAQLPRLHALRRSFQAALARIPYHRLSFYATTETLVDQYNRLCAGTFRTLPYPINSTIWEPARPVAPAAVAHSPRPHPLLLTSAGAIRREKGQRQVLQHIVDSLGDNLLADGTLALQVQLPRRRFGFRRKLDLRLPPPLSSASGAIRLADHPLPVDQYVELIRTTDIGLLAYDANAYFSRRAGILGEYLAAGRPVIVPAACWLSEQIAGHTEMHVREQLRRWPHATVAQLRDLTWTPDNVPQHGGIISCDQRHPFVATYALPAGLDAVVWACRWHAATPAGAYCRLEFTLHDDGGQVIQRIVDVHDAGQADGMVHSLVPLQPAARALTMRCSSAVDDRSLSLRDLQLTGLGTAGVALPRSAVGLIAADVEQIPMAIREMVQHYPHYRATAEEWSQRFREAHRPDRTLDALLAQPAAQRSHPRSA